MKLKNLQTLLAKYDGESEVVLMCVPTRQIFEPTLTTLFAIEENGLIIYINLVKQEHNEHINPTIP